MLNCARVSLRHTVLALKGVGCRQLSAATALPTVRELAARLPVDKKGRGTRTAQTLWKLNLRRKYKLVSDAHDEMVAAGNGVNVVATQAAIFANGELHRSFKAKELFDSIPTTKLSPTSAVFLMHAFALENRLGSAERLMFAWLSCYANWNPDDAVTSSMLERLGESRSVRVEAKGSVLANELQASSLGKTPIPLGAWVSLLHIYGQRQAWQQCWAVLNYLESAQRATGAYPYNRAKANRFIAARLDQLTRPAFHVTTPFQATRDPTYRTGLQWSAAYHITLRALAEADQWPLALQLLRRMRGDANNIDKADGGAFATPQISAAICLLRSLTSAVPGIGGASSGAASALGISADTVEGAEGHHHQLSLSQALHSATAFSDETADCPLHPRPGDAAHNLGSDAFRRSILLRRQLAVALAPDVTAWIKRHVVPARKDRAVRRVGVDVAGWHQTERVLTQLAKEFTLALCRLDLMAQARVFVTEVMQHVIDTKFPVQGEGVSGTGVGSSHGPGVVAVVGFRDFVWLTPYLQRLREVGDWEAAAAVHRQIEQVEATERAALHKAAKAVMAGGKRGKESGMENAHKRANRARVARSLHARLDKLSQRPVQAESLYHDTATALRRAGKLTELAKFMEQHKAKL